jgi:NAD(P)-dependent dehydrogenase (short-subunit alcohol dehydrogenase family)
MGVLDKRANLSGKIAAVIGGAIGIGEAVTMALAEAGVDLAICDWDAEGLEATAAAARAMGRRVFTMPCDVLKPADIDAFYDAAPKHFDHLDIVVNLAGGVRARPFMDSTPEHWDHDIQRNFRYVVQSVQRAVPLIRKSGRGGSIINFSTIEARRGAGNFAVYAGAKAGLENFTRAVAVELGPERIRVNTLAPDTTPTKGNADAGGGEAIWEYFRSEGWDRAQQMYLPLQTPAAPEDQANAVLFLASDLSRFTTGSTLQVDGGSSAAMGFVNWPGGSWSPCPGPPTLSLMFPDLVKDKA